MKTMGNKNKGTGVVAIRRRNEVQNQYDQLRNRDINDSVMAKQIEQLVRFGGNIRKKFECCICLEQKLNGLHCESRKHFTCLECLTPYVELLCQDVGKLRDATFQVRCPVPRCPSPHWHSYLIHYILDGYALDRYIDTLVKVCNQEVPVQDDDQILTETQGLVQHIVDSLSLKCPWCRIVLDPTPDGCCAMRCENCGTHFCWLCFKICTNSASCHDHLKTCPISPRPGDMFFRVEQYRAVHNRIRKTAVYNVLKNHWFRSNANEITFSKEEVLKCPTIVSALQKCSTNFTDLGIDVNDCLVSATHSQLVPKASTKSSCLAVTAMSFIIFGIVFATAYYLMR
jgi:hypothetical protein